jgi:hypothetical protein
MGRSMRTDHYRYVEWRKSDGQVAALELYDHEKDPEQNANIAEKADKALLDSMAKQCKRYWQAARPGA